KARSEAAPLQEALPQEVRQRQAALREGPQEAPSPRARPPRARDGSLRALVQRVSQAAVDVEGERVAQIGPGMLVLLGVGVGDGEEQADRLADKVAALRIFDDAEGKMN